jgi:sugar/nucleoside kinase (ribokinase family)
MAVEFEQLLDALVKVYDIHRVIGWPRKQRERELRANQHQRDFVAMGVAVVDSKDPNEGVVVKGMSSVPQGGLGIAPLEIARNRGHLTIEQLLKTELGGLGNVASPAASLLSDAVGAVGYIGDDIEGRDFSRRIRTYGVDASGLIVRGLKKTDISAAPITPPKKGRAQERGGITFLEHAGRYLDFSLDVMKNLIFYNPRLVQISYSGLMANGADRNGGKNLARGIRWIQKTLDAVVMVDTHTYEGKNRYRYDKLLPALGVTDLFACSDKEAGLMYDQYVHSKKAKYEFKSATTNKGKRDAMFKFFEDKYCHGDRAKLFAVTSSEEVTVLYYVPSSKPRKVTVKNWFFSKDIYDPVGAGDSWKAGLNAYILTHLGQFKAGTLDLAKAVQYANLTARLYISGPNVKGFRGRKHDDVYATVNAGKPKRSVETLNQLHAYMQKVAKAK